MSDTDGAEPVTASWTRIVRWLEHSAPVTAATIAPPADPLSLRRREAAFPSPWPADLREWYSLQDGAPMQELWHCVLPMFAVLSLDEMAEAVVLLAGSGAPEPAPSANENAFAFIAHYVPIGDDGCGDTLYVDLRPGPQHGCVGEYSASGDSDTGDPRWSSVSAMLADVADSIETSRPLLGWLVPGVVDGELSWTDVEEER